MTGHGSSYSEYDTSRSAKLFGRVRPIHEVLGGGKVADVLLWKNWKVSGALLIGMTFIWFLFEVVKYNFITFLCHIAITTLLVFFIWSNSADLFKWNPPNIPENILHESEMREIASTFHIRFNQFLSKFLEIAYGRDQIPLFFLAIVSLYALSVVGNYFSFLNLLYLGILSMETLPFLYDRYEDYVEYFVGEVIQDLKRKYKTIDSKFLNKIPRAPVKEKKIR
ncbi:hypothetical protein ACB098_04G075300 [Castanea mollissima]|uniref:Reticulon-like protein n=1 Tax=Castanea mollissima TaxID=60419 RepID=A0A8J4S5R8_9ROSI|nr:hypothetical protein CMV_000088 [Castanea mollissima]